MSFFALKISAPNAVDLVNSIKAGSQDIVIQQLNQLENELKVGEKVFMQLGGDKVSWEKGLIGLAQVTKEPFDKGYDEKNPRNFRLGLKMVLTLKGVIKREEFRFYTDAYDAGGIGPNTKGEQNQAIKSLTDKQAYAILRAMAEKDNDIKGVIEKVFDSDICNKIFGKMSCMVESEMTYDEMMKAKNGKATNVSDEITPAWFKIKAADYPTLDHEAKVFLDNFLERFSVEKLKNLSGVDVLNTIFLNNSNKTNLCCTLEYDADCRFIFGSIKNGSAYKYGLHYSQKNKTWIAGTKKSEAEFLSEEDAIEVGTALRDNLVAGAETISSFGKVESIKDYKNLYEQLYKATDGNIEKIWFLKYYAMLYTDIFPPIYSTKAQNTVIERLGLDKSNNVLERMGIIREYVDLCDISSVVFSRIFWLQVNNADTDEDIITSEEETMDSEMIIKSCLDVERMPRTVKIHPINFIIYGAPGTGKTYSMVEYSLAIVDNIPIDEFRKNNPDRKTNVSRYKSLVKEGQIVFTTFHQNYGYEEFIQGLRPDKDSETMAFKTVDGVFKVIADKALNDTEDKNFVIVIDEINRANISKVFGELITLIEEDKRWGELNETSVTLQSGDSFAVPNNLYIVGTMNSADKSISLIDAALRRRFDFIEQKPDLTLVKDSVLNKVLETINLDLVEELDSTDLLVGHSYFMNKTQKDLCNILNNNIIPLLYEYFYDNRKKVANLLNNAIKKSGASVEIVDEKVGRLRVKDV